MTRKKFFLILDGVCFVALVILTVIGVRQWATHTAPTTDAPPGLATVDIVAVMNAERAMASRIIGSDGNDEATLTVAHAGKKLRETIAKTAGPNTVVLVKQAIVADTAKAIPDITDQVLKALGLPTDTATVSYSDDLSRNTNYGNSDIYQKLKKNFQHNKAADESWRKATTHKANEQLIP